jgi:hypothetical protein
MSMKRVWNRGRLWFGVLVIGVTAFGLSLHGAPGQADENVPAPGLNVASTPSAQAVAESRDGLHSMAEQVAGTTARSALDEPPRPGAVGKVAPRARAVGKGSLRAKSIGVTAHERPGGGQPRDPNDEVFSMSPLLCPATGGCWYLWDRDVPGGRRNLQSRAAYALSHGNRPVPGWVLGGNVQRIRG